MINISCMFSESIGDLQAELNNRLQQQPQITNGASALTAGDGGRFILRHFLEYFVLQLIKHECLHLAKAMFGYKG